MTDPSRLTLPSDPTKPAAGTRWTKRQEEAGSGVTTSSDWRTKTDAELIAQTEELAVGHPNKDEIVGVVKAALARRHERNFDGFLTGFFGRTNG